MSADARNAGAHCARFLTKLKFTIMSEAQQLPARTLNAIANDIRRNWTNVYFGARPYLAAMAQLDSITDTYEQDTARAIVLYFLGNAQTWRGEKAKEVKAELNAMLKKKG